MQLVGRYVSPFSRRVGVSACVLGLEFEHLDLSAKTQMDEIRKFNPMGRVPALRLDDGTILIESAAILDWLDEQVEPERRLVPAGGVARRDVLQLVAWASGAGEKMVAAHYERTRRPEENHRPVVDGYLGQVRQGLNMLEAASAGNEGWLYGERMTQADISAVVFYEFAKLVLPGLLDGAPWPALDALCDRAYDAEPAFAETDPKPH